MNNHAGKDRRILPQPWIRSILNSLNSVADVFVNLRINPNTLTIFALLSGMGAGLLFWLKEPGWAIVAVIGCGVFDVLDGKVAVKTHTTSKFGAIFDSTLDRYSEFFIYLGIALYFRNHWAVWLIFFTFLGSSMVSYTRARAEGLGIECKIGIMQRAERMVLISLGSATGIIFNVFDITMIIALGLIALVSNFTALQRTFYVRKIEGQNKPE